MANSFIISARAKRNLNEIFSNIVNYTQSYKSGERLLNDLYKKFELIAFLPLAAGRQRNDDTREAFCRGYRIVYEVQENFVYIVSVIHSRMIYPRPNEH